MSEENKLRFMNLPKYILPYSIILLLLSFCSGLITPVLIIYYRKIGLTLLQIGVLATVFELSMGVFEIPTGFIADKFGRKISVLFCFLFFTISGIFYMLTRDLTGFIIAAAVQGIAYTFISGALQAWGVDTLKQNGNEDLVKNMLVSGTQGSRIGFLLGSLLGGYLGLKLINSVWIVYITVNLFTLIFTLLFMKESKVQIIEEVPENTAEESNKIKSILQKVFIDNSKYVLKMVIGIFVVCVLYEFSLSPIEEYWTVLFSEDLNIATFYFGWLIVITNILIILTVRPVTELLSNKFTNIQSLIIVDMFIISQIVLLAITTSPFVAMLAYIFYKLFVGIYEPIEKTFINSLIGDKFRATVLSVYNMAGAAGEVISGVSIGLVAELLSLKLAFFISAGTIIVVLFVLGYLVKVDNNKQIDNSIKA